MLVRCTERKREMRSRLRRRSEILFCCRNAPVLRSPPYLLLINHHCRSPGFFFSPSMFASALWQRAPRIVRSALSTQPRLGGPSGVFVMPCRKVVVEYCEKSIASKGTRDFLLQHAASLAHANPSVEFVIIPRPQRAPVLRGFYCTYATHSNISERPNQGDLDTQHAGYTDHAQDAAHT